MKTEKNSWKRSFSFPHQQVWWHGPVLPSGQSARWLLALENVIITTGKGGQKDTLWGVSI